MNTIGLEPGGGKFISPASIVSGSTGIGTESNCIGSCTGSGSSATVIGCSVMVGVGCCLGSIGGKATSYGFISGCN